MTYTMTGLDISLLDEILQLCDLSKIQRIVLFTGFLAHSGMENAQIIVPAEG